MKNFLSIYKNCVKYAFAGAIAYRLNFILTLISALCFYAVFPLVTVLVYSAGASFPGWDLYEVLLIQSIFILSSGLCDLLINGVLWSTMDYIRNGSYEVILLKPMSPLVYLGLTSFNPECVSMIIGGSVLFWVSIARTETTANMIFQFPPLFAAGVAVMTGGLLIVSATSFKWVGNSRIIEIYDSIMTFGKYPVNIFPQALRTFLTFIVPASMIGHYPAAALLDRGSLSAFFAVIPCYLFMLFGVWLYMHMIKLYEGVGG